jgi:hypothetical protein
MGSDKQLWLGIDIGGGYTGWLPAKCYQPVNATIIHPVIQVSP